MDAITKKVKGPGVKQETQQTYTRKNGPSQSRCVDPSIEGVAGHLQIWLVRLVVFDPACDINSMQKVIAAGDEN